MPLGLNIQIEALLAGNLGHGLTNGLDIAVEHAMINLSRLIQRTVVHAESTTLLVSTKCSSAYYLAVSQARLEP